jgi:ATP-binding cassette subfamily B protein
VIAPWRWLIIGAIVSAVAGAGLTLLPPLILRRLIDGNLSVGRVEGIFILALGYLGATAAVHVTQFLTGYGASVAAQGALRRLRVQLFDHLQNLPIEYYDHTPVGDVISRCTADMETVNSLFSSGVISLLAESLRLVVTLAAMIALSLPLSLALLLALPVLVVTTRWFQLLMRKAQRTLRTAVGELIARLQESLTRTEVIRAFAWEFRIVQRFRRALAKALSAQNRSVAYGAVYSPFLNILQAALVAAFLTLSASPILQAAQISIGTLTAFILLFDQFFSPLISVGNVWQVVQSAFAGLERIFQVLSLPADGGQRDEERYAVEEPESGFREAARASAETVMIDVDRITFGYLSGRPVLSHVSLQVETGRHYAIVGRTGAGKSSLFNLLGGLYRPWQGTIRLAGKDPNRVSSEERRRIIGAVPQVVWLFSGSVAENLAFGDETISRTSIERAGRVSGAESFVAALPDGYDTIISDAGQGRGVQISAGQRQLLALARALVADPAVLLLDEATAAVDGATEAAFKRALREQIEERQGAVITIAHRLSTAVEADRIIVMEGGRIVEEGRPAELLNRGGPFASLWELESAGWEWDERKSETI